MTRSYTINMPATLAPARLSDLLVTFIEGGGCHWCAKAEFFTWEAQVPTQVPYSKVWREPAEFFGDNWSVHLTDNEGKVHRFGWRRLRRALQDERLRRQVLEFLEGDEDADTADVIIQTAALGEVVYG